LQGSFDWVWALKNLGQLLQGMVLSFDRNKVAHGRFKEILSNDDDINILANSLESYREVKLVEKGEFIDDRECEINVFAIGFIGQGFDWI
jgi:hypothetical protein